MTSACQPDPDEARPDECGEDGYCIVHWPEALAEHAWMAQAAREQAALEQIVGGYEDQIRDAGRGHLLRPS